MGLRSLSAAASCCAWLCCSTAGNAIGQSADVLYVLTTTGYLTGAADACKVAATESNALSSAIGLAIAEGGYGDKVKAHTMFNGARQEGTADAVAKKVNCDSVGAQVRQIARKR